MRSRLKILVPVLAVAIIAAGVLVFLLTKSDSPKATPKSSVVKGCSLLSMADATKYLGSGTYLQQAKTSTVDNVNVVGCQYSNKHTSKSIVIGQRTAATNYGEQALNKNFFVAANGEAEIKFASYLGFTYPKQPGDIRVWFKNTWLSVFSPSQKISEAILTNFVKTH